MVRISIPSLPIMPILASTPVSLPEAISVLQQFLSAGPVTVLTGAGVSVDSGIRAYRGKDGRYMNPNYQPILYQELVAPSSIGKKFRQRYWARSYLGYPPVRDAKPNASHYGLSLLQRHGKVGTIITQNVDGLHLRAGAPKKAVVELHGTLFVVRCSHGHEIDRNEFQEMLGRENPGWKAFVDELEASGQQLRTNPDGDIELEGRSYDDFIVPACPTCRVEGREDRTLKPDVVFFGESVPEEKKNRSLAEVASSERLLVVGTTLATYSAYRLFQLAHNNHKPVVILNIGPTRADTVPSDSKGGTVTKLEVPCGELLREVAERMCANLPSDKVTTDILSKLRSSSTAVPTLMGPEMKSS